MLQVHTSIGHFFGYRIRDGNTTSVWFDRWCPQSPLMNPLFVRVITRVGFKLSYRVADVIRNGTWNWPNDWLTRFPMLTNMDVPDLDHSTRDTLFWRDVYGSFRTFSVVAVWESI